MRHRISISAAALTAFLAAGSSCVPQDHCETSCTLATARLTLIAGNATFTAIGGAEVTVPIYAELTDPMPDNTCYLSGLTDVLILGDNTANGHLFLSCAISGRRVSTVVFRDKILDPRAFDSDTTQPVNVWGDCMDPSEPGNLKSTATIQVSEAVGASAPYPTMVSKDFVRRYVVELDTGAVDCSNGSVPVGCPICSRVERLRVTLSLAQTAGDYTYDTSAPCWCE